MKRKEKFTPLGVVMGASVPRSSPQGSTLYSTQKGLLHLAVVAAAYRVTTEVLQETLCDLDLCQGLGIALGTETLNQFREEVCHIWLSQLDGCS